MLVPPRNGSRSTSRTDAPARAAAMAAVEPAEPAPTTHTSTVGDQRQLEAAVDRSSLGLGLSGETDRTDQPPSILSSWPVTTRDSSDRK